MIPNLLIVKLHYTFLIDSHSTHHHHTPVVRSTGTPPASAPLGSRWAHTSHMCFTAPSHAACTRVYGRDATHSEGSSSLLGGARMYVRLLRTQVTRSPRVRPLHLTLPREPLAAACCCAACARFVQRCMLSLTDD